MPHEDLKAFKTLWDFAGMRLDSCCLAGVKEVGVRGMEKKGPETWGRDRGWEGEVVAVKVAQKTAGNHGDAHTTGSSLIRQQQCLPEVCWAGRVSGMNEQPFPYGHLLQTWWLASGEGAGAPSKGHWWWGCMHGARGARAGSPDSPHSCVCWVRETGTGES